jgi:hypothetical protein
VLSPFVYDVAVTDYIYVISYKRMRRVTHLFPIVPWSDESWIRLPTCSVLKTAWLDFAMPHCVVWLRMKDCNRNVSLRDLVQPLRFGCCRPTFGQGQPSGQFCENNLFWLELMYRSRVIRAGRDYCIRRVVNRRRCMCTVIGTTLHFRQIRRRETNRFRNATGVTISAIYGIIRQQKFRTGLYNNADLLPTNAFAFWRPFQSAAHLICYRLRKAFYASI